MSDVRVPLSPSLRGEGWREGQHRASSLRPPLTLSPCRVQSHERGSRSAAPFVQRTPALADKGILRPSPRMTSASVAAPVAHRAPPRVSLNESQRNRGSSRRQKHKSPALRLLNCTAGRASNLRFLVVVRASDASPVSVVLSRLSVSASLVSTAGSPYRPNPGLTLLDRSVVQAPGASLRVLQDEP